MKKLVLHFLTLFCGISSFGQNKSVIDDYKHYAVIIKNDTINYHTYAKTNIDSINNMIVYVQGSRASAIYYKVKKENDKVNFNTAIPFDFSTLPDDYMFVVISKKGFPFTTKAGEEFIIPKTYYENQTLAYRAFQTNEVINEVIKKHDKPFSKIIALGHSEGSDVVAKLGTINKAVTHFGYWSGGGNTQFIDFVTFVRNKADCGKISEEQAELQINAVLDSLKAIMANPDDINKHWMGKTNNYKRWSGFSEPPIENLLQIDKPIFAAIGSKDKAVAVESAYLIPVEFIRHQKNNLTFKVYPGLDHSFKKPLEDGTFENNWDKVFANFLNWVDEN